MNASPRRFAALTLLALAVTSTLAVPGSAGAEPDAPDDTGAAADELADVADPPGARDLHQQRTAVAERPAPDTTGPIDDFRYDALVLEGRAADVCAGRILQGSLWAYEELTDRFGGSPGSMYSCRERWDAANDPDCNGTVVDPATSPDFYSTCWSNHARGRAIDIMVGSDGAGGYITSRGLTIVNWLLADDAAGNPNALARRLGVQQILFADRCWNSDGDRGIAEWSAMRECDIGHHDHVHIDMTLAGSRGDVSFWGARPRIAPKFDRVLEWDRDSGEWATRRFGDGGAGSRLARTSTWAPRVDAVVAGDWDADGRTDDVILWDQHTGRWVVRASTRRGVPQRASGHWNAKYDQLLVGDLNRDGKLNDLFLHDAETGSWAVKSWWDFAVGRSAGGRWSPDRTAFDTFVVGDLDDDGRRNDMVLWDRDGGDWVVERWAQRRGTQVSSGTWDRRFDRLVAGDLDAGGDVDEMLLWDQDTGDWQLLDWDGNRPWTPASGDLRRAYDDLVVADVDRDDRLDDVLARDVDTGDWVLHSWHRWRRTRVADGTWQPGDELVVAGTWR